ncbi:MAG: LPS assembly protein LptD, partial [Proteobacteria bacterium]|nr:LPS assembly protein LptD [Pseudomonadota bacterium]
APTYATSSHLGLQVEVPYYFNLAPHRDATFAPVFTGREGVVLAGEYRERTHAGAWRLEGSVTNPRERRGAIRTGGRDVRGHARASGRFDLGPGWRWGFDGARSTDDTYLRRYGISSENTLVSNAYVEGLDGRNYAAVNAWAFQGLREDDIPGQTPLVLPMVDYLLVSDPGPQGQTVTIDANLMGLTRNRGTDSWRASTAGTWRLPYTAPLGDVYTVSASLRGDAYVVSGVPSPNTPAGRTENVYVGRVLPRVALDWRFPLVRPGPSADLLLEPVVALIVAPRGGNPDKIPNEDSLSFEFDDTNLFSASRFPGLDRWESGPRMNYGLRFGAYGASSSATALLGQTLRDRDPTLFDERSGLQTGPSDYVGRVHIATPNVDYFQRLRMDQESFSLRRNEIGLRVGDDDLNFTTGYVFLSEELSTENLGRREELSLAGRAPLGNGWRVDAQSRHDLSDPGGLLLAGIGLVYECDCMQFSIDLTRRLTSDRDVPRSTTISLRLRLRHLG